MSRWRNRCNAVCALFLLGLAVSAGVTALFFANIDNQLGAVAGLALSVFWGTVAVGWRALGSSERCIRAQMHKRTVKRTMNYLLAEARRRSEEGDGQDGEWAGLVDRISGLASTTIAGSPRHRLRYLRQGEPGGRVKPSGGPFDVVCCPNLSGEIIEWIGFALLTWSVPGLAFALWTIANLVPRALWRRRWYRENFSGYPKDRAALFPGLL